MKDKKNEKIFQSGRTEKVHRWSLTFAWCRFPPPWRIYPELTGSALDCNSTGRERERNYRKVTIGRGFDSPPGHHTFSVLNFIDFYTDGFNLKNTID